MEVWTFSGAGSIDHDIQRVMDVFNAYMKIPKKIGFTINTVIKFLRVQ